MSLLQQLLDEVKGLSGRVDALVAEVQAARPVVEAARSATCSCIFHTGNGEGCINEPLGNAVKEYDRVVKGLA